MSDYIRRGECLEAVAKVNSALVMLQERIRQLRKDVGRLEEENRALKEQIQLLEVSVAVLKSQSVGCLQAVKESRS